MKKNISINIGGIIFHIEEDGYDKLKSYLDSVNTYFSTFEDSKEIIEDIEGRIAEIFLSKLDEGKQVISQEDVDDLILTMGTTKDFDATIEAEPEEEPKEEPASEDEKSSTKEAQDKKLFRDTKRKVIGGVASGIAHYFGIDPIWTRLIFLALFFISLLSNWFFSPSGFILLTYVILWIAIPGNAKLEDDKGVKKLYRDTEDRVLGGVSSGIASYFGVDKVLIRVLFVVSIFLGGAGLLIYIILWIITPEAKTITEKMQMQGEPVTITNIEENVKKSLKVEEGEENVLVKILLFPFRLIAMIFKALGEILGPLLRFTVEALRVIVGVVFVMLGFSLMVSLSVALAVLLGIGGSLEGMVHFGGIPADYIMASLSTVAIVSSYLVAIIPSLGILLLGLSIIVRKMVTKAFIGWSMFGLWLLGMVGLAFSVPALISDFSTESNFVEEREYPVSDEIPTLRLNDLGRGRWGREGVELRLRGHQDENYQLKLDIESRGANRSKARENANAVEYNVIQDKDGFAFDSHLSFGPEVPFRLQKLKATFYIPYGQKFRMERELAEILRNTLYLKGYRIHQMKGNDWAFYKDGLTCLTCDEDDSYSFDYRRRDNQDTQTYEFSSFDEVHLLSFFDFEIVQGEDYVVELEGDDDLLDKISLVQRGDELVIRSNYNWKWWRDEDGEQIKVFIKMPELDLLLVEGACEGEVRGFDNDEISFDLNGASEVWSDIRTEYTYAEIKGASELTLVGRSDNLEAEVVGASELKAYNFKVEDAEVTTIGGSSAKIYVTEVLEANAVGASTIRYRGNPSVSSDSRGLSSIKRD